MLNLNTNRTEIAITKDGEDYIRIIPRLKDGNQLELVFTFLCHDFIIRDYTIEKQQDFRIQTSRQEIEGKEIDLGQLVKQSELCVFQEQFDVHEKRDVAMEMHHDFACRRFLIEQCPELVIGIGKYPW